MLKKEVYYYLPVLFTRWGLNQAKKNKPNLYGDVNITKEILRKFYATTSVGTPVLI